MTQETASYLTRLEAELERLGCGTDQVREVLEEVFGELGRSPGADPAATFGPAPQYALDVVTGRRPPRTRYLRRLGAELSGRGLPGDRVGQVLAEVEEHVRDSGQSPVEAFGEPAEYARQVVEAAGLPAEPPAPPVPLALLVATGSTAGTLLAAQGLLALLLGGPAPLTAAVLVAVLVLPPLGIGAGLLARRPAPVGLLAGVVGLVGDWAAKVVVLAGLPAPVLATVPAAPMLAVGVGLLALALLAGRGLTRTALPQAVPDPRPGAVPHPAFDAAGDRARVVRGTVRGLAVLAVLEVCSLTLAVLLLR